MARQHIIVDEDIHNVFVKENTETDEPIFLIARRCLFESPTYQRLLKKWGRKK